MLKFNYIKTLTAGFVLATAFYPQAWAATSGCCNSDCTCSFKVVNDELIMTAVGNNVQAHAQDSYGENSPWRHESYSKITIGEGITSIKQGTFYGHSVAEVNLPQSLRTIEQRAFINSYIGKIEIPDAVTFIGDKAFSVGVGELIISSNSNYAITAGKFSSVYTGTAPNTYNVSCKGVYEACQNRIVNIQNYAQNNGGTLNLKYYAGDDGNGNWEVWSEEGKAVYADSTLQKPLGKYDLNGNQTGVYKYDGAGNLTAAYENGFATFKRTSYTPAEAAAAVKKGNDNKVTFTFK